jgi:hypothetical protein
LTGKPIGRFLDETWWCPAWLVIEVSIRRWFRLVGLNKSSENRGKENFINFERDGIVGVAVVNAQLA